MSDVIKLEKLPNYDCILPNQYTYKDRKARGSKIIIVGKPGSGKSTLLKSILKDKSDIIKTGIAMSGSEGANEFYREFFPPLFVYEEYDDQVLADALTRQSKVISNKELAHEDKWLAVILDDCADQPSVFRQKIQKTLFKNGSHFRMFYIICMQFALDMPLNVRTAVDGVFLFRETNLESLKLMYVNYAAIVPSFDLFKQLMLHYTGDHQCLFLNNALQSNDWKQCVYYCKADVVDGSWRFGSFDLHQWNNERFNPLWDDPEYQMNQALKELPTTNR